MKARAVAAVQAGQKRMALALVEALLQRDAADFGTWLLASRLRRDMGDADGALQAARMASKLAKTDTQAYQSSMLVAQALSTAGRRTEAQLWLRWAAEQAPDARAKATALRDFRYVRSRNPLSIRLNIDVAPSSNINNGSSQDIVTLFGLPFQLSGAAQALSGTRIAGGAELKWRFDGTAARQSEAVLSTFHQSYVMSEEAKQQAPTASGSDFAYSSVALTFRQKLAPEPGRGYWTWELGGGRSWYGGSPYTDFVTAGLERTFRLGRSATLSLGGDVEVQNRLDGSNFWSEAVTLDAALFRRLPSRSQVRLDFAIETSSSNDSSLEYTAYSLAAQYQLGKPVMDTIVTFSGGVEWRDFPVSPYKAGGRADLSGRLGVELLFPKVDYWGFAPVLTMEQSLRHSDVDLYDSDTISVKLGIRSVF
jgi:hypothetical protein